MQTLVAAEAQHCIYRVTVDGRKELMAGQEGKKGFADGAMRDALFDSPRGIAVELNGDILVADTDNRFALAILLSALRGSLHHMLVCAMHA